MPRGRFHPVTPKMLSLFANYPTLKPFSSSSSLVCNIIHFALPVPVAALHPLESPIIFFPLQLFPLNYFLFFCISVAINLIAMHSSGGAILLRLQGERIDSCAYLFIEINYLNFKWYGYIN